jgi:hypothetical protein
VSAVNEQNYYSDLSQSQLTIKPDKNLKKKWALFIVYTYTGQGEFKILYFFKWLLSYVVNF